MPPVETTTSTTLLTMRSRITRRRPAAMSGPASPRMIVGRSGSFNMRLSTSAQSPMFRACSDIPAICSTRSATDGSPSRQAGRTGREKRAAFIFRRLSFAGHQVPVLVDEQRAVGVRILEKGVESPPDDLDVLLVEHEPGGPQRIVGFSHRRSFH